MDDVVANAVSKGVQGHLFGEFWEDVKEVILVNRSGRTGGNVDEIDARAEREDFGSIGIGAAGEDIDRNAETGGVTGELADINVHAARVLAAKGRKRGCMDRDRGHAPNHICLVSVDSGSGEVVVLHRTHPFRQRRSNPNYARHVPAPRLRPSKIRLTGRNASLAANAINGEATTEMIANGDGVSCESSVVSRQAGESGKTDRRTDGWFDTRDSDD